MPSGTDIVCLTIAKEQGAKRKNTWIFKECVSFGRAQLKTVPVYPKNVVRTHLQKEFD